MGNKISKKKQMKHANNNNNNIDDDNDDHRDQKKIGALGPPVGVKNVGNSCFMSVSLQCLVHIPCIADHIIQPLPVQPPAHVHEDVWHFWTVCHAIGRHILSREGVVTHYHNNNSAIDITPFCVALAALRPEYANKVRKFPQQDALAMFGQVIHYAHQALGAPITASPSSSSSSSSSSSRARSKCVLRDTSGLDTDNSRFDELLAKAEAPNVNELRVHGDVMRKLCRYNAQHRRVKNFELLWRRVARTTSHRRLQVKGESVFTRRMYGQCVKTRVCSQCGACVFTFPLFVYYDIPLPVEQKGELHLPTLLQASVTRASTPALASTKPCWQCEGHDADTFRDYTGVLRAPDVVTLRLVRSVFKDVNNEASGVRKIKHTVRYPLDNLDITPLYFHHTVLCQQVDNNNTAVTNQDDNNNNNTNPSHLYNLCSVMSHHGYNARKGHYVANVRHLRNGRVYTMNDQYAQVCETNAADNMFASEQAYVLIYERSG